MNDELDPRLEGATGIALRIVPLIFAIIGATIIFFVWTDDEFFSHAPTFFKVFASLVATVFVVIGLSGAFGSRPGLATLHRLAGRGASAAGAAERGEMRLACSNCGATLDDKAEISPSGDVKCPSCGGWFNTRT